MEQNYDATKQFHLESREFLDKMTFVNWYRYFFIVREVVDLKLKSILEIGPGEETVKHVLAPYVEKYETFDINSKLKPNYIGDVRDFKPELQNKFDCVIAADILEHIPFEDETKTLKNLHSYLQPDGRALITVPHRVWYIFGIWWLSYRHFLLRSPDWVRRLYHRGKNTIDPDHKWEIGDGKHKIQDFENAARAAGFKIEKLQKLIYVDFWTLRK